MKFILAIFLITLSASSFGQYISIDTPKYKIVKQDTINVKGTVYDVSGKPVIDLRFTSKNKEAVYSGYRIYASTDINGKFELDGVLAKDTLDYIWNEQKMHIVINGSRSLLLYLPLLEVKSKVRDAVVISARRKVKKHTPVFKVITNADINDWYGILPEDFKIAPEPTPGFTNKLKTDIIYPEQAINNNIEGDVEIGFTIGKDGKLSDFKLLRGIGYGCDDEVLRVLKKYGVWRPGIFVGRPVVTQSYVTINFELLEH